MHVLTFSSGNSAWIDYVSMLVKGDYLLPRVCLVCTCLVHCIDFFLRMAAMVMTSMMPLLFSSGRLPYETGLLGYIINFLNVL